MAANADIQLEEAWQHFSFPKTENLSKMRTNKKKTDEFCTKVSTHMKITTSMMQPLNSTTAGSSVSDNCC